MALVTIVIAAYYFLYHTGKENFLHFYVEMAHFVGILAVNFKFHCMNKTVKIHQNQTDTLLAVIMHEYLHRYFENIKN